MALRHSKVSSKQDGPDSSLIQPSDWNADHVNPGQSNGDLIFRTGGQLDRLPVGNNGEQLTVVAGAPAWAPGYWGLLLEAKFLPNPTTNWRSVFPFFATGTTLGLTAGRCYFIPFAVQLERSLTDLGFDVSTASAGTAEVAIYASDEVSGRPGTRLAYVSGLTTDSTGVKSGAISVTLQPGLYLAALRSSASATVRATSGPLHWAIWGTNNRVTNLYSTESALNDPVWTDPTTLGFGTVHNIYARWS